MRTMVFISLFCRCYSNSVSFIELLRIFASYVHGEVCAKILCSEKELLNLKDSKLTQNFYSNKTGFVRPGHKINDNCISLLSYVYILGNLGCSITMCSKVTATYIHVHTEYIAT